MIRIRTKEEWNEKFPIADWKSCVASDATRLGYEEWLRGNIERVLYPEAFETPRLEKAIRRICHEILHLRLQRREVLHGRL